eukprot:6220079-Alexandrium_andersonii.AAC.1
MRRGGPLFGAGQAWQRRTPQVPERGPGGIRASASAKPWPAVAPERRSVHLLATVVGRVALEPLLAGRQPPASRL